MERSRSVIRDGVVVGVIAYAAVALFYSVFDLLAGRGMLFTVNLLGQAVFRGVRDPSILRFPVALDLAAIFLYNALHLALSLAIGLVVTWLVTHAEERPARALPVMLAIVAGGVLTVLAVGYLTREIRPLLPWWSIVVANLLAVSLAALYLVRRRPGFVRRIAPSSPTPGHG